MSSSCRPHAGNGVPGQAAKIPNVSPGLFVTPREESFERDSSAESLLSSVCMTPAIESEDDEQGDSEMQDDNTMDGGESNDDLPGNEDDENHDMGDNDSVGGVSTVNEPADHEPLEAGACWDAVPDRKKILRLAEIWGSKDLNGGYETLLQPTARDVVFTAMASVQFLEDIGEDAIDQSKIGIDRAGGLIKLKSPRTKDFRKDFSDMVSEVPKRMMRMWGERDIERALREYITLDNGLDEMHDGLVEVRTLLSSAKNVVEKHQFDIVALQQVQGECKKAMVEMNKVISAANPVKQDLVDTGATSLKRWNALLKTKSGKYATSGMMGYEMNTYRFCVVIARLEGIVKLYMRVLMITVHLEDRLDATIDELRDAS